MRTVTSVFALAAAACFAVPAAAQEVAPDQAGAPQAAATVEAAPAPTEEAAAAEPEADAAAPAAEAQAVEAAPVSDSAAPQEEAATTEAITEEHAGADPFEGFNRSMYSVNDALDEAVVEPVARGYRAITNRPIRSGVRNFLRNLRAPIVFVNDVLQGEPERAGVTAGRFALNTTVGFFGLFDVAERNGLEWHDEDFGQTLAVWGVGPGPYMFVPVLGPSNLRDSAGRVVDIAFSPLTWAEFDGDDAFNITRTLAEGVSTREQLLETVDDVKATSIDPYTTVRTTYALTRESAVRNGLQDVQALPEFNDTFEPLDEPVEGLPAEPSAAAPEPLAPGAVGVGEQGMSQ